MSTIVTERVVLRACAENDWIQLLRSSLHAAGYVNTRLVAKDKKRDVSFLTDLATDPALAAAIDVRAP